MSPPGLGVTLSRGLVSRTVSTTFSTSNYFDMSSIWYVLKSHLNIKSNTSFFRYNQVGKKRSSLDYRLVELLLDLKTASYINKICNNSCVDI